MPWAGFGGGCDMEAFKSTNYDGGCLPITPQCALPIGEDILTNWDSPLGSIYPPMESRHWGVYIPRRGMIYSQAGTCIGFLFRLPVHHSIGSCSSRRSQVETPQVAGCTPPKRPYWGIYLSDGGLPCGTLHLGVYIRD